MSWSFLAGSEKSGFYVEGPFEVVWAQKYMYRKEYLGVVPSVNRGKQTSDAWQQERFW